MPDTLYFVNNGSTKFCCGYHMARNCWYGGCVVSIFTSFGESKKIYFTF